MNTPQWNPWIFEQCENCSGPAEVLTTAEEDFAYDGDEVRCTECGMPGSMSCDDGVATIMWHDEPDCDCEWCLKNPIT